SNAIGITTELAPSLCGSSVSRAKYWPSGRLVALIVTQNVVVPVFGNVIEFEDFGPLVPGGCSETEILTPGAVWASTPMFCGLPRQLMAGREVVSEPVIVGASMLGRLRSIRWSGSLAEAT